MVLEIRRLLGWLNSGLIVTVLSFDVFLSETSVGEYNEWTRLMRDGKYDLVRFNFEMNLRNKRKRRLSFSFPLF